MPAEKETLTGAQTRRRSISAVALCGLSVLLLVVLDLLLFIRHRLVSGAGKNFLTAHPGWMFSAVATLGAVALLVGAVIIERRRQHEVHQVSTLLTALEPITDALLEQRSLDAILEVLTRRISEATGGTGVAIHLVTEAGDRLQRRAVEGALDDGTADRSHEGDNDGERALPNAPEINIGTGRVGRAADLATVVIGDGSAAYPMVAGGRVVGVIDVTFPNRAIGDDVVRLLRVAADRVATAIEGARLNDAEIRSRLAAERAQSHLSLLAKASELFDSALDGYEPALRALADVVVPSFADWSLVDLSGADGVLRHLASRHVEPSVGERFDHLVDVHRGWAAPIRQAVASGEAALGWGVAGRTAATDFDSVLQGLDLESWMVMPVRVRGLSLGAIVVGRGLQRRGFRPSDLDAGRDMARRAAVAIERVLLYQDIRAAADATTRNADQLRRLMHAAPAITAALLPKAVLEVLVAQACRVLGAGRAIATVPDLSLRVSSAGDNDDGADAGDDEVEPADVREPGSWLAVPIRTPSAVQAGAILVTEKGDGTFTEEDQAILASMAELASASLENARLYLDVETSQERLRALVEAAPLAIIEIGLDRQVRRWNRATQEMFGWPIYDEALRTQPEDVPTFPASLDTSLVALIDEAERGVPSLDVEVAWSRSEGRSLDFSVATVPLRDGSGAVNGFLAVLADVTVRKQLELRLLVSQRMEAIGRLAGGIAHDFNNLLTVILGHAELLLRRMDDTDSKARGDVQAIRSAGEHGAKLTAQLLAIGSHQVSESEVVSIEDVISNMAPVLRRLVTEDITVSLDLRPGRVLIDPSQFEQVVLNLVVNAGDSMPNGGHLAVSAGRERVSAAIPVVNGAVEPGQWVVLSVGDTGVGMDPEVLAHCFEPFFTTKGRTRGTGLGLATVFGIVEQNEGRIDVESALGQGTTVRVYLPAAREPLEVKEPEKGPPPGLPAGSERVLLVEDDAALRHLVSTVLASHGYVLIEAANGVEALEIACSHEGQFDLLLTDVVMPEMDGVELATRVGERWPDLPVLYMSGYTGAAREKLAGISQSGNFLSKPFKAEDLARRVRELLDTQGSKR